MDNNEKKIFEKIRKNSEAKRAWQIAENKRRGIYQKDPWQDPFFIMGIVIRYLEDPTALNIRKAKETLIAALASERKRCQ